MERRKFLFLFTLLSILQDWNVLCQCSCASAATPTAKITSSTPVLPSGQFVIPAVIKPLIKEPEPTYPNGPYGCDNCCPNFPYMPPPVVLEDDDDNDIFRTLLYFLIFSKGLGGGGGNNCGNCNRCWYDYGLGANFNGGPNFGYSGGPNFGYSGGPGNFGNGPPFGGNFYDNSNYAPDFSMPSYPYPDFPTYPGPFGPFMPYPYPGPYNFPTVGCSCDSTLDTQENINIVQNPGQPLTVYLRDNCK